MAPGSRAPVPASRRRRLPVPGDAVPAVYLAQEVLDQLAVADVLDLVHHPPALAADPAAADVEHLDRGLELIPGQGDDVAVGAVGQDHRLLLQRPLQGLDVVAEPGGALELLGRGRGPHLGLQTAGEPGGLAGHEVAELLGQAAVLGLADPLHARRRALADVAQQARPADLACPLEHPGRAGPDREHPQQRVHGLPDGPGVGVRAEVAGPAPPGAAHHHDPRVLLVHGDREVGVALVVPVADVETGVELLDPGVLQLERLDLGADDGPVDPRRRGQHRLGARVEPREIREIGIEPGPQVLGLAHVDDPAAAVAEPVDPRRLGDRAGGRPVGMRIRHAATLWDAQDGEPE